MTSERAVEGRAEVRPREDWRQTADRYDRQRRIAGWEQDRLERAHVFVAGAGAIGNEAMKLLALLGIGRMTVIDMDRIETSNLSRMVLFREEDVGRWKAVVAAERVRELQPGCRVEPIVGDLEHDLGLGRLRKAQVILGCLDNLHARIALNRAAQRLGIPWVNAAIDARALEVTAFSPEGSCYECGLGAGAWRRYRQRFSCGDGLLRAAASGKVATVATVATLAAAFQVEAMLALLHAGGQGEKGGANGEAAPSFGLAPGERLYLSLSPLALARMEIVRAADCLAHERWDSPLVVPLSARTASFELLAGHLARETGIAASALDLGFDLVTGLRCPKCDEEEARLVPKGKLARAEARCHACGADRIARSVEQIPRGDRLAGEPLARLGIPERAILRVRAGDLEHIVELGESEPERGSGAEGGDLP